MTLGIPDYIFPEFTSVTPDFLRSLGIKLLVCDIDNTLAPYEIPEPNEKISAWLTSMRNADIRIVFVSNNHSARADRFNQTLGFPVYANAKKPLTMALTQALADAGLTPREGAALGDQIFTDVLAGQFRGLTTLLVPPIRDKTTLFFRSKRFLERPFIAAYFKKHPDSELYALWNRKTRLQKEHPQ